MRIAESSVASCFRVSMGLSLLAAGCSGPLERMHRSILRGGGLELPWGHGPIAMHGVMDKLEKLSAKVELLYVVPLPKASMLSKLLASCELYDSHSPHGWHRGSVCRCGLWQDSRSCN